MARSREGGSPVQAAAMQLVMAGAVLALVATVSGELSTLEPAAVTARSLASFVYLVVFGSLITYSAYVWLLRRVGCGHRDHDGHGQSASQAPTEQDTHLSRLLGAATRVPHRVAGCNSFPHLA